jgi:translation elongation factor EF-Tu-like GTPase
MTTFQMTIKDCHRVTGRGLMVIGRISEGELDTGDTVQVELIDGSSVEAKVRDIERGFRRELGPARKGEEAGVFLDCEGVDLRQAQALVGA